MTGKPHTEKPNTPDQKSAQGQTHGRRDEDQAQKDRHDEQNKQAGRQAQGQQKPGAGKNPQNK